VVHLFLQPLSTEEEIAKHSLYTLALSLHSILINIKPFLGRGISVCGVKDVAHKALLATLTSILLEASGKFDVVHADVRKINEDTSSKLSEGDFRDAVYGVGRSIRIW
jgi:hypothetical protein